MKHPGPVRCVLLYAGLVLLALSVFAAAVESKTILSGSANLITRNCCKAVDLESRLKAAPVIAISREPVRLEVPVFHAEVPPPPLEIGPPARVWFSADQFLRPPPAV